MLPSVLHRVSTLALLVGLLGPSTTRAQEIPAEEYLRFVPLEVPRIIGATSASEALHVYGDRGAADYADENPVDGIDDRRHDVLQELAVRFAPFLVQNSEMIPMDLKRVWGAPNPLQVHAWNTTTNSLMRRESIDWMTSSVPPCGASPSSSDDCRLLELLREYDPRDPGYATTQTGRRDPLENRFDVLWVDMPGNSPTGWKSYWRSDLSRTLKPQWRDLMTSYVHPFLEEVRGPEGPLGVQLVLQYWFFYPYNDGGNDHEGDWEHIHVVVAPKRLVEEPAVSDDDMRRLLRGDWLAAAGENELVIKRVEYYFHSKVASLDFGRPNAYLPEEQWRRQSKALGVELNGEEYFRRFIRQMAWRDAAETEINTHPVGYIGADNKGLDQILSPPGGTNRDSHGTYPMPGLFKDIGPAGASETIANFFDHRAYFAGELNAVDRLDVFTRGGVIFLGEAEKIQLVPDYERVIDLVFADYDARQQWSWLVLPVRFGYPAVVSPFSGVVANAETGNLSIAGPAFNSGWNRSGATGQYQAYIPQVLPRLFPTALQDAFVNDWGYFNAAVPLTFLPPFDIAWRIVAAPVRSLFQELEPTFYPRETIPLRFVGLEGGVSHNQSPNDYQELFSNPAQIDGIIGGIVDHLAEQGADSTTVLTSSSERTEPVSAPLLRVQLFIGDRISTTNSLVHFRSDLENRLQFNNIDDLTLNGELNWWEYTGSLRYSLLTGALRPYLKGGYGLSWYRLEDVAIGGELLDAPNSPWIRKPGFIKNVLPNTWHVGGGLELLTLKGFGGLPGGLDLALSAEWLRYTNKIGLDAAGLPLPELILLGFTVDDLPRERWIGRTVTNLTVSVSY